MEGKGKKIKNPEMATKSSLERLQKRWKQSLNPSKQTNKQKTFKISTSPTSDIENLETEAFGNASSYSKKRL